MTTPTIPGGTLYVWDGTQWILTNGWITDAIQGPPGPPGSPFSMVSDPAITDPSQLPQPGNPGVGYVINGTLWLWNGTTWVNAGSVQGPGVPSGGSSGDVLTKNSGTDFDTIWSPAQGGGGGGSILIARSTFPASNLTITTGAANNDGTGTVVVNNFTTPSLSTANIYRMGISVNWTSPATTAGTVLSPYINVAPTGATISWAGPWTGTNLSLIAATVPVRPVGSASYMLSGQAFFLPSGSDGVRTFNLTANASASVASLGTWLNQGCGIVWIEDMGPI
jgi:hypothetical protein